MVSNGFAGLQFKVALRLVNGLYRVSLEFISDWFMVCFGFSSD